MGQIQPAGAGAERATVTALDAWLRDRAARHHRLVGAAGAPVGEVSTGELATGALRDQRRRRRPAFSWRERVVLALVGSTDDEAAIATLTGFEPSAVRAHLAAIHRKYAAAGRPAPSRAHLALRAVQDGLDEAPVLQLVHG